MRQTATEHKVFWKGSLREEPLFQQRFSLNTELCNAKRALSSPSFATQSESYPHRALQRKARLQQRVLQKQNELKTTKKKRIVSETENNAFFILPERKTPFKSHYLKNTFTRCFPGVTGREITPSLTTGATAFPLSLMLLTLHELSRVRRESLSAV